MVGIYREELFFINCLDAVITEILKKLSNDVYDIIHE